jgi:hypothetical protein
LENVLHAQCVDGETGFPEIAQDEEAEVHGHDEGDGNLVDDRVYPVEVGHEDVSMES